MKKLIIAFLLINIGFGYSQSTIKTMFYNVLDYPSAPPNNREQILEKIIDSYEPDIFMICELENEEGGEEILNESLNDDHTNYSSAPFLSNFSNSDVELHQLLYYNNQKFNLIQSSRISNTIRDINWYTLELTTENQDANPIKLEVFVTHLKASPGGTNEQKRLDMVKGFIDNQINLDPDAYVIFAGDFNLYSSDEPAYEAILNTNNRIVMVDPINTPGSWNNNPSFAAVHTQSTRISSEDFENSGSGGGVDSRFDFIMISDNMVSNPELSYVKESYASYGNNGNCYNQRIDDTDCTGLYNLDLREELYNMSDHIPVVMELQTDQNFLSTPDFSRDIPSISLSRTVIEDILSVQIRNASRNIQFKIYNTLGQVLKQFSSENQEMIQVSLNHLSTGIYYLTTDSNNGVIKFVKQN